MSVVLSNIFCETSITLKEDDFSGFDFKGYEPSSHTLEDESKSEIKENSIKEPYYAVGHSQGGVRVLAYATMLEQRIATATNETERIEYQKDFDNLKGVITVSGIDKGIRALDGGFGPFRSKLADDATILYHGLGGLILCGGPCWAILSSMVTVSATLGGGLYIIKNEVVPPNIAKYIAYGLLERPYEELSELYDMMPQSEYIKKYVSSTEKRIIKTQSGKKTVLSIEWTKRGLFKVPVIKTTQVPVYSYYTQYYDNTKFSNKIPVGYIVGTHNDTLSMFDYGKYNSVAGKDYGDDETKARSVIGNLKTAMDVGYGCNMAKYYTLSGLELVAKIATLGFKTFDFGSAGAHTNASYCDDAADWYNNVDRELNELKGSDKNDGLVAEESQYYPEYAHTNVLRSEDGSSVCRLDENHASISPFISSEGKKNENVRKVIELLNSKMIKQRLY